MAIEDDFTIDQAGPYLVVRHSSGTAVYTVNQFFTWLCQQKDEPGLIVDYDPMTAETPTAYTMREGCFLDTGDGSELHKYLSGGSISTDKWDHGTYDSGIRKITLDGAAGLTEADKGKVVLGGTTADTGRLLAYDAANYILWVRPDTSADIFDDAAETIDVDSVFCGNTIQVSETGEELWANPRTVASFAGSPDPQVYIEQDGAVIAEWSDKTNWDRGTIDVLIKVTDVGVDIDSKIITAFARQQGDDFAHYQATMTAAGQDVVVLNSASDLQNTTGDYYLLYDAGNGTDFTVGEIIEEDTAIPVWSAEVSAQTEWTAGVGVLEIRNLKGTITDAETFTGVSSGATGTTNGTEGDTYLTYDAETTGPVGADIGESITGDSTGAVRILRGYQDDGADGKLVAQVDTSQTGSNRDPQYKAYSAADSVTAGGGGTLDVDLDAASTTLVSGWDDITVAFVNGTATYDAAGGTKTLIPGERVTWNAGAESGIFLLDDTPGGDAGVITLGNCTQDVPDDSVILGDISGDSKTVTATWASAHTMSKNFEQQASNPYDVIVECGSIYEAGRAVSQIYQYLKFICQEDSVFQMYRVVASTITPIDGEIYRNAYSGYAEMQKAPFGENPGGQIFGARGVWFEGYATGELTNIAQVVDSDADVNTPPVTISITVAGDVESGVQVIVTRTTAGVINKSMYISHATNNAQGDSDFEVTAGIDQDTPSSGVFRVVDDSQETEHRYRYGSWQDTPDRFNLLSEITSTCESAGGSTDINDTGIESGDIEVGDLVRNVTSGDWAHVVSISANLVVTTPLQGPGDQTWDSGDTYSFHTLAVTYETNDTVYVPYLDERATGASVSVDVLFDTGSKDVTVRGRKAGLKSHISASTVDSSGLNVALIMPTDPNYNL